MMRIVNDTIRIKGFIITPTLILAIRIKHVLNTAIRLSNGGKLPLAHALLFHVNELILDTTLLEKAFCFLRIITFLCT